MEVVKLEHVSRVYTSGDHEIKALSDVDLSLEEGKFIADITTNGGERYEKLPFAIEEGYLRTERDLPDYIMEGLVNAFKSYLAQEQMLSTSTQPAPRPPQRKQMPETQWQTGGGFGSNFRRNGGFGGNNPFGGL